MICMYKKKRCKEPRMASFLKQAYTCRFYEKYDRARPLLKLMKSDGWCKRDLFCLDGGPKNLPLSSLWFYAHMVPPRKGYKHKDCSRGGCQYDTTIDEDNYEVMHMDNACNCQLIGPPFQALKEIVEAGDFPVVSVTPAGDIKVERGSRVREYVALSHVWSDGHGNNSDNALPTCFLKPLSLRVSMALGTGEFPLDVRSYSDIPGMISRNLRPYQKPDWFWIDTLCIPRQPYELRAKAIQGMREPFARAKVVLIFDNRLTHVQTRNMSDIEMYARLKMSNWARRLWTFQEDAFGQHHYVQFGDRSVDLLRQSIPLSLSLKQIRDKHVMGEMQVGDLSSAFATILNSFGECHEFKLAKLLRYGLETRGQLQARLGWYRSVLKTKSTTRNSDQALCLASLMNLDMQKITEAKPEERMKVFWSLVERFPIGILFSKSKNKLNFEGYRWAPASFLEFKDDWKVKDEWMGPESLHEKYIRRTAECQGQKAELPVIYLQTLDQGDHDTGLDRSAMESLLQYIHGTGHKARFFDDEGLGWNVEFEADWHKEKQYLDQTDGLAIVLGAYACRSGTTYQGLLISYKQYEGYIQAHAHRHVKLKRISTPLPCLAKGFEHSAQVMRSRYTSPFLVQLLWDSEKADEPEKVNEAEAYLHQLLDQQQGFIEEDSTYWREYFKTSVDYTGTKTKRTERSDTVVMWSLFWPRVKAKLSEKKVCVCID